MSVKNKLSSYALFIVMIGLVVSGVSSDWVNDGTYTWENKHEVVINPLFAWLNNTNFIEFVNGSAGGLYLNSDHPGTKFTTDNKTVWGNASAGTINVYNLTSLYANASSIQFEQDGDILITIDPVTPPFIAWGEYAEASNSQYTVKGLNTACSTGTCFIPVEVCNIDGLKRNFNVKILSYGLELESLEEYKSFIGYNRIPVNTYEEYQDINGTTLTNHTLTFDLEPYTYWSWKPLKNFIIDQPQKDLSAVVNIGKNSCKQMRYKAKNVIGQINKYDINFLDPYVSSLVYAIGNNTNATWDTDQDAASTVTLTSNNKAFHLTTGTSFTALAQDDFNRADSATLGVATNGNTWTDTAAWHISNHSAYSNGNVGGQNDAELAITWTDSIQFNYTWETFSNADTHRMILRTGGASNFQLAEVDDILKSYNGGGWVSTGFVPNDTQEYTVRLENFTTTAMDLWIDGRFIIRVAASTTGTPTSFWIRDPVGVGGVRVRCLVTDDAPCQGYDVTKNIFASDVITSSATAATITPQWTCSETDGFACAVNFSCNGKSGTYFALTNNTETNCSVDGTQHTFNASVSGNVTSTSIFQNFTWTMTTGDPPAAVKGPELKIQTDTGIRGLEVDYNGNTQLKVPFGEMYIHDDAGGNVTISNTSYYFTVDGMTAGFLNRFSFAANALTALDSGLYRTNYAVSFGGGSSDLYEIAIKVNDVVQNNCELHRKLGTGGDAGSAGGSCLLNLTAGNTITMGISDNDATADAEIFTANVNMIRIGH